MILRVWQCTKAWSLELEKEREKLAVLFWFRTVVTRRMAMMSQEIWTGARAWGGGQGRADMEVDQTAKINMVFFYCTLHWAVPGYQGNRSSDENHAFRSVEKI